MAPLMELEKKLNMKSLKKLRIGLTNVNFNAQFCAGGIFTFEWGVPLFNTLFPAISENIATNHILPKIESLGYTFLLPTVLSRSAGLNVSLYKLLLQTSKVKITKSHDYKYQSSKEVSKLR